MKPSGIITLSTDFGLSDSYVGVMKGVIYGINPHAKIVDLTHNIPHQNIEAGAFILDTSYRYFPQGTIHVAVVDPGVGSKRRILAVQTNDHFFIAPDNQILKYIFNKHETFSVVNVLNKGYFRDHVSHTFHGRDIFAPVAAHLSNGVPFSELGNFITDFDTGEIHRPEVYSDKIIATIIYIDAFGNLITNIEEKHISNKSFSIKAGATTIKKISNSYAENRIGDPLAIMGSSNFLEISIRNGNAKQKLGLDIGATIEVFFAKI